MPNGFGKVRGQRVVEGGISPAAEEEAMNAAGVRVLPDDLAGIIDADCVGADAAVGEGVIEGSVFVDRHDLGLL
jgi:hypothetical protein